MNPQPEPQRTPLEILTAYVNQLWGNNYDYGYDIDNLMVIGMHELAYAFGFQANDVSPWVITRYYSEENSEFMALQGTVGEKTFTIQQYKNNPQLTEADFKMLESIDGFVFPVSESEWQTLIGLVNNAAGATLPLLIPQK